MATAYELYIMKSCPFCRKVIRFMYQHNIDLPLRDINEDPEARATLERVGGEVQVPCLFIDGKPLYESDDIIAYLEKAFVVDAPRKLVVKDHAIRYRSENGAVLAEVTFPADGEGTVNIDHTFVDEALRGQGMAGKLMDACAQELERAGLKAHPTCSYAVSWFEKHPEWAHLLA